MTEITATLSNMKRPGLLIRAARIALENFRRDTMLGRILGEESDLTPSNCLGLLMELENGMNEQRKTGDAAYSIARHISVLTALLHEVNLSQSAVSQPT